MGSITIFHPETGPELLKRDTPPDLAELQSLVGGYIEIPARWFDQTPDGRVETQVIVNEDAMRRDLPRNRAATLWLIEQLHKRGQNAPNMLGGYLLGTMVVLQGSACID